MNRMGMRLPISISMLAMLVALMVMDTTQISATKSTSLELLGQPPLLRPLATSWSPALKIFTSTTGSLVNPSFAMDAQGNWHLVYASSRVCGDPNQLPVPDTCSAINYASSQSSGVATLAEGHFYALGGASTSVSFPSITFQNGSLYVAYVYQEMTGAGTSTSIMYMNHASGSWSPAQKIFTGPLGNPSFAVDAQGNWHLVYVSSRVCGDPNQLPVPDTCSAINYASSQSSGVAMLAEGHAYMSSNTGTMVSSPSIVFQNGSLHVAYVYQEMQGPVVSVWMMNTQPSTYSISGRVANANNDPISGATISDGASDTTTTDSNGNYTLSGLAAGTYTITPTKNGYTFSPTSRNVTMPPDATGQDFTAKRIKVVLVHGWHGEPADFYTLDYWLEGTGQYTAKDISYFEYDGKNQSFVTSAISLTNYIENLGLGPGEKVDIVAHSLGGLVSRYYIEKNEGYKRVRKLIMLGTPNHGFWVAGLVNIPGIGDILKRIDAAGASANPRYVDKMLNIGFSKPTTEYAIIAGTGGHEPFLWTVKNDCFIAVNSASMYKEAGIIPTEVPDVHSRGCANKEHPRYLQGYWQGDGIEGPNLDTFQKILGFLNTPVAQSMRPSSPLPRRSSDSAMDTPIVSPHSGLNYGTILSGNPLSYSVSVDSSSGWTSFVVFWPNDGSQGSLDLTLQRPDGSIVNPSTPTSDPTVTYVNDGLIELSGLKADYYVIQSPSSGVWTMKVSPVNVPSSGKPYLTTVFLDSPIDLGVSMDKDSYNPNDPISITAALTNNATALTGASVAARVQKPNGTQESVILYDDGLHGDGQANDGIYSNTYTNTSANGSYAIQVSATGSSGGVNFVREDIAGVAVGSGPQIIYLPVILK